MEHPDLMNNSSDLSGYEDDVFINYIETTVDPGNKLLIFTIFFCIWCTLLVPVMFVLHDKYKQNSIEKETTPGRLADSDQMRNKSFLDRWRSENIIEDQVLVENKEDMPNAKQLNTYPNSFPIASDNQHDSYPTRSLYTGSMAGGVEESEANAATIELSNKDGNKSAQITNKLLGNENRLGSWRANYVNALFRNDAQTKSLYEDFSNEDPHEDDQEKCSFSGSSYEEKNLAIHDSSIMKYSANNSITDTKSFKSESSSVKSMGSIFNCKRSICVIEHLEPSDSDYSDDTKNEASSDEAKANSSMNIEMRNKDIASENKNTIQKICVAPFEIEVIRTKETYSDDEETLKHADQNERRNDNPQIFCGANAIWRKHNILRAWNEFKVLIQYDQESRQIMKLALPYTIGEILDAIFDMIDIGLIGHFLGTKALAAGIVAETLLGLTDEFVGGIIDACGTVIPHCVGTGNNFLAGQYVQISAALYTLASLPIAIVWWVYMYDAIILFGFEEDIAALGAAYTRVALVTMLIDGVAGTIETFLEVTGHEVYCLVLGIVGGVTEVAVFIIAIYTFKDLDLIDAAYLDLALTTFFCILFVVIPLSKGWLNEYIAGMFKNIALKNSKALKNLVVTAAPLSAGTLLAYGEWECLTIFAAFMGPAEVAAWGVLGSIWETFEASTEAIGDSAEVRVGYHLGKGDTEKARTSANKSLLWGTCVGVLVTIILFAVANNLAAWFTTDLLIQNMISEVIPYIGLGNVTMTFGMLCWSILGAQGRYGLATFIVFLTSFGIVVPSAAVMTYCWKFNLKGLVSSIVLGYTVTSATMTVIILKSDWEKASREIIAKNQAELLSLGSDSNSSVSSKPSLSNSSRSSSESSDLEWNDINISSTGTSDTTRPSDDENMATGRKEQKGLGNLASLFESRTKVPMS